MPGIRLLKCVVLLLSVVAIGHAGAAVQAESASAVIELAAHVSPVDRLTGDFSILIWVHPDAMTVGGSSIFEIPGVLSLGTDGVGNAQATLRVLVEGATEPEELVATNKQPLMGDRWHLCVLNYRAGVGVLELFVVGGSGSHTSFTQATGPAVAFDQPTGGPRLGQSSAGVPAMLGAYGLLVVRTESIKASEALSLFQRKRYFGPYDNETSPTGSMTGPDGAVWMLNHCMSTLPTDIDAGGVKFEHAAIVGELVGRRNVHVYDDSIAVEEEFERFIMVRQVEQVSGFRYVSYREAPLDDFFNIDPSPFGITYPSVPGNSPVAHQLVTAPRRPIRVMVSSNSRAVFRDDGSLQSPGNYTHGFIDLKRSQTAGVFFRPAVRGWGSPWFGFDCRDAPLNVLTELTDSTNGRYQHFSRFWTGSARGPAEGPGGGIFIEPGGNYEMRCRPEPGSLMTADKPLVVEASVMAFPGASPVLFKPRRGETQRDPGIDVAPQQILNLNTETYSLTFEEDDRIVNSTAFVLKGQHEGLINPGDAIFISSGPGQGHLSIIRSVTQGITQATIQVTMPMANLPDTGSVMHFGPWHFERISYTFDPVPQGDLRVWRGLYLSAALPGGGLPVYAFSAWRPNVNGYIFGVAGWGGNGYYPQLIHSEDEARPLWMAESRADVWFQVPAQQNSFPEHMRYFTDEIRLGLPECEIIWAGEAEHPTGASIGWTKYIVDHAAEFGVVGIAANNRVQVGTALEQLADGHRSNLPHISRRGNLKLAALWCELLADAALVPCPADFAAPWGAYDFFDLQVFLTRYLTDDAAADLNEDGQIDFFDVQAFLVAFSDGCP